MKIAAIVVVLSVAGCAGDPRADELRKIRESVVVPVPVCHQTRECEGMWAAARKWVVGNCGMKIQTMSESFIETYNSPPYSVDLHCRATKDPLPAGGYTFSVDVDCSNWISCQRNPQQAAQDFNSYVNMVGQDFRDAAAPVL